MKIGQNGHTMESDELPSLGESMGQEKTEPPKIDPEVLNIPDDSTSTTESGNSSFIFKPTTVMQHQLLLGQQMLLLTTIQLCKFSE